MILYEEALSLLKAAVRERGLTPLEKVPLAQALGRVAAEALSSEEALPPFDNSSMDGYAVRARDTAGASRSTPVRLPVSGSSSAGDAPAKALSGAWEIMTGAAIPEGLDAVVQVESLRVLDGGRAVEFAETAERGDFIRERGSDYRPGDAILSAGTPLDARHLLALAALGIDSVPVRRKPRVAVISTGRELVDPGRTPAPGQIRNATASYLLAALPLLGAEVRFHGTSPDDSADFRMRVEAALAESPDILVTTGAVSMGKHDFVTEALAGMGAETLYHKVAIRPGKPGLAARFPKGPLVLGLPGNPLSTVVGVRFFLTPVLRGLLGLPQERPLRLRLRGAAEKPLGLRGLFKARAALTSEGAYVEVLRGQASFQIQPLLEANAWAVLPEQRVHFETGTELEVFPLLADANSWAHEAAMAQRGPAEAKCC